MYSRRNCVRVAGVTEDMTDTDDVILDIASKFDIPIKKILFRMITGVRLVSPV